jgi:hypothetical protein
MAMWGPGPWGPLVREIHALREEIEQLETSR